MADANNTVGIWPTSEMHRNRTTGNSTCRWTFLIDESENSAEDPPVRCAFEVRALTTTSKCERSPFQDVECGNGKIIFLVSGGWNSMGFTVLVLVNHAEAAMAYFGYSDTELNDGGPVPEQRKAATMITRNTNILLLPRDI